MILSLFLTSALLFLVKGLVSFYSDFLDNNSFLPLQLIFLYVYLCRSTLETIFMPLAKRNQFLLNQSTMQQYILITFALLLRIFSRVSHCAPVVPQVVEVEDRVVVVGERHNFAYFPAGVVSGQGPAGQLVPVHLQYALSVPSEYVEHYMLPGSLITRQEQPVVRPSVFGQSGAAAAIPSIVWQPPPDQGFTILSHSDGTPFHHLRPVS